MVGGVIGGLVGVLLTRFTNKQLFGSRRDILAYVVISIVFIILVIGVLIWDKYKLLEDKSYILLTVSLATFWTIVWLILLKFFPYLRSSGQFKFPWWFTAAYSAGAIVGFTLSSSIIFIWYNAIFDKSSSNVYVASVLKKEVIGKKEEYFRLTTEPLRDSQSLYTRVFKRSREEHLEKGTYPGSKIRIVAGKGALGVEWVKSIELDL